MAQFQKIISDAALLFKNAARLVASVLDGRSIGNVQELETFIGSRAAFIAQSQLYGCLKTRMGAARFRDFFEDETFARKIRIAGAKVFCACLSDLTVFAVAILSARGELDAERSKALARRLFGAGLERASEAMEAGPVRDDALAAFDQRLETVVWAAVEGESAFSESPAALLEHAPTPDDLEDIDRDLDEEIVFNAFRSKWGDVREQLRKRLDVKAVLLDLPKSGLCD